MKCKVCGASKGPLVLMVFLLAMQFAWWIRCSNAEVELGRVRRQLHDIQNPEPVEEGK